MISGEGERVEFLTRVKVRNQGVEMWMSLIEQAMQGVIQKHIKTGCTSYYQQDRKEWVVSQIGQAVATVAQIAWTEGCECFINDIQNGENPLALQE